MFFFFFFFFRRNWNHSEETSRNTFNYNLGSSSSGLHPPNQVEHFAPQHHPQLRVLWPHLSADIAQIIP